MELFKKVAEEIKYSYRISRSDYFNALKKYIDEGDRIYTEKILQTDRGISGISGTMYKEALKTIFESKKNTKHKKELLEIFLASKYVKSIIEEEFYIKSRLIEDILKSKKEEFSEEAKIEIIKKIVAINSNKSNVVADYDSVLALLIKLDHNKMSESNKMELFHYFAKKAKSGQIWFGYNSEHVFDIFSVSTENLSEENKEILLNHIFYTMDELEGNKLNNKELDTEYTYSHMIGKMICKDKNCLSDKYKIKFLEKIINSKIFKEMGRDSYRIFFDNIFCIISSDLATEKVVLDEGLRKDILYTIYSTFPNGKIEEDTLITPRAVEYLFTNNQEKIKNLLREFKKFLKERDYNSSLDNSDNCFIQKYQERAKIKGTEEWKKEKDKPYDVSKGYFVKNLEKVSTESSNIYSDVSISFQW